jgi:hypothetical protein
MKKIVLTFILIPIFILKVSAQSNEIDNSILPWHSSRDLNWSDFQGEVDPNTFGSAMTSHKIEVLPTNVMVDENDNIQDYEKMTVQAQFYKNKSWTTTKSDLILIHEQLHFDIAELFARKIRKRFTVFKLNNVTTFSAYLNCYNLFWKECRKMQRQYDSETSHGQNESVNEAWVRRVRTKLGSLSSFE